MKSLCPICSQNTRQVYAGLPGYQESEQQYEVMFCEKCDTCYALPMETEHAIYQHIYENGIAVPGYNRYHTYAVDVKKTHRPLSYLAASEDVYWGVFTFLKRDFPHPENITVLEAGCGLGYLTYALNQHGYATTGIDISEKAIFDARARYGDYYRHADVMTLVSGIEKYDAIILTEVIEHITDPKGLIAVLVQLLKPNGKIFISTPDRAARPNPEEYWDTDLPPIHFWWFSVTAFQNIADTLNLTLSVLDNSDWLDKYHPIVFAKVEDNTVWRQPAFDKNGNLLYASSRKIWRSRIKSMLIIMGIMPVLRQLFFWTFPKKKKRHNRYAKLMLVFGEKTLNTNKKRVQ